MTLTCTTCAHWNLKRAGQMARHSYGLCDKGKPWAYKAPGHACKKHSDAPAPIVAARVKWLKAKGGTA